MTAAAPTPAVERAAAAIDEASAIGDGLQIGAHHWLVEAQSSLTAALTDPDDPDWLARTLFQITSGFDDAGAERWWNSMPTREGTLWRNRATRLRATITGSGA